MRLSTTRWATGSVFFLAALLGVPRGVGAEDKPLLFQTGGAGMGDRGIFEDLAPRVQLAPLEGPGLRALIVRGAARLLVFRGDRPVRAYRLGGPAMASVAGRPLAVPAEVATELASLSFDAVSEARGDTVPLADRDQDGIPDRLDLLIGAHKTALNRARYGAGYMKLSFPGGDVPRDVGVCTDVVIRALRNVGLDLQAELHRDIGKARRAYPMVSKPNPHIDHRRVKTLLPYFKRHMIARSSATDDAKDPFEPGDIVFMDTFPSRSGPEHIGIVSDRLGPSGNLLVINNWTDGFVTSEMDLLSFVPVTHRFRLADGP